MSNKIERKCEDCRVQKGLESLETEDLNSENDSGNSLSSDIGSVEDGLNSRKGDLRYNVNELSTLRQELTQTVQLLEELSTKYNKTATRIVDIEQQMAAQATNLNKVSVEVRPTNKTVHTHCQYVSNKRLEIHGLVLGEIIIRDFQTYEDEVKTKIVQVGNCFGVEFSVADIDKVDILGTKRNLQQPILLVHFFSKRVRDMLIAERKKRVINAYLPEGKDETRIYINENLCSYYKRLWFEARRKFKYVWFREGKLFVRKNTGSRKKRITCEEDIDKLEAE